MDAESDGSLSQLVNRNPISSLWAGKNLLLDN